VSDELDKLSDAELSDVFAVTMGVTCDPDDYATSADAVMPWLEKREWSANGGLGCMPVAVRVLDENYREHRSSAPTFARAACIALIRAKRAENSP